ncbi:hypothetical protein, partial [Polyangium sp. 15x6]|uniref:hypothetical protein n=1 Tax=Polyangium sp. 15x6 TaxID=3042687 RepID=UPI00249C0339
CAAATNPPSARRRGEHARAAHVAPAMGADGRPDGGGRGLTLILGAGDVDGLLELFEVAIGSGELSEDTGAVRL